MPCTHTGLDSSLEAGSVAYLGPWAPYSTGLRAGSRNCRWEDSGQEGYTSIRIPRHHVAAGEDGGWSHESLSFLGNNSSYSGSIRESDLIIFPHTGANKPVRSQHKRLKFVLVLNHILLLFSDYRWRLCWLLIIPHPLSLNYAYHQECCFSPYSCLCRHRRTLRVRGQRQYQCMCLSCSYDTGSCILIEHSFRPSGSRDSTSERPSGWLWLV